MKETVYSYNSGNISSDGQALVFKKDRAEPFVVHWNDVKKVEIRSRHIEISGQRNSTHHLIIRAEDNRILQEWQMPNRDTATSARNAIKLQLARRNP
jgi:hypothetical protein